ncbi:MAG: hypothetical protein QOE36_1251 [Gaiellaceae bacterium]|jgi:hypothetical protein|nr:hypothetical protein [Gaiellaceae bacterium]
MLPNLIIIGAAKSGTTALHRYLRVHPEIWMSPIKELNYFVAEQNWGRGIDWYSRWFPRDLPVRGESSPKYSCAPKHPGVPDRMVTVVPDTRLIYVVRDPLERMRSDYVDAVYHAGMRWPVAPFEEQLRDPTSRVYSQSCYWQQLQLYRAHFPDDRIHLVQHEALRDRRDETLRSVFRFLGVDESFTHGSFRRLHNETRPKRRRRPAAEKAANTLTRWVGPSVSARARGWIPAVLSRPFTDEIPWPEIPPALRPELEATFHAEAERLRSWSGLTLESWSV